MTKESNKSTNGSPISLMPYLNARTVDKGLSDIMLNLFLEDPDLTTDKLLSLGQKFKELDLSKDELDISKHKNKIIYKLFLENPDFTKVKLLDSVNNNLNHVQSTKKSLTGGLEILNNLINENNMEGPRPESPSGSVASDGSDISDISDISEITIDTCGDGETDKASISTEGYKANKDVIASDSQKRIASKGMFHRQRDDASVCTSVETLLNSY